MSDTTAIKLTSLTSAKDPDAGALRRVLWYGLLAGLCPLIPIPFIDDVIIKTLRKRMIDGQLRRAGLEPARTQVNLFTHEAAEIRLLGCLLGAAWVVVKKVFRKLIYVFAIKDCVDNASRVVHHGWLVHYALHSGALGAHTFEAGNDEIKRVRNAMLQTCDQLDPRPLNQALSRLFRGSRSLIKGAASSVGKVLRAGGADRHDAATLDGALDGLDQRDVGELERILDRMVQSMGAQRGYLLEMEKTFDEALER